MSSQYSPNVAFVDLLARSTAPKETLLRAVRSGVRTAAFRACECGMPSLIRTLEVGTPRIDGAVLFAENDFFFSDPDDGIPFVDHLDRIINLGLRRLVILCNDNEWDEDSYDSATGVKSYLAQRGFPMEQFTVELCPLTNFVSEGDRHLPAIQRAMDAINRIILAPTTRDEVFRMPIKQVFSVKNLGTIAVGVVAQGRLTPGEQVEIVGYDKTLTAEVAALELFRKMVDCVETGDDVGIILRGVSADEIERGMMVTAPGSTPQTWEFSALLHVLAKTDDGQPGSPLLDRHRPTLSIGTAETSCVVSLPDKQACPPGCYVYARISTALDIPWVSGMRFRLRCGNTVAEGSLP